MNILKESKENLPIDFITQQIAKGWDEVGLLNSTITAIKQAYKGTAKIEEVLQDLADAYLISISRLQAFLSDKENIILPDDTSDASGAITEELLAKSTNDSQSQAASEEDNGVAVDTQNSNKKDKDIEEGIDFNCEFDDPEIEEDSPFKRWTSK